MPRSYEIARQESANDILVMMRGDTGAARRIRKLLDSKGVPYERHLWV